MSSNNRSKDIEVSKGIEYLDTDNQYFVQMKRRRFPWWILLCLLPLLLFIKCNIDIEVTCVEAQTGNLLDNQEVTIEYTAHFLFNHGEFFANDPISRTQTTDADGKTVFKDMPCSVFSYIFYCLSEKTVSAQGTCYSHLSQNSNFHFRRKETLTMEPVRADLYVKILDLETNDPLPDGYIHYSYYDLGEEKADSAHADASGVVKLPNMPVCSTTDILLGKCYGYADTSRINVLNSELVYPDDNFALKLRPIKERFTFFVKNVETGEPIPAAICHVTLTHPSGRVLGPRIVTTSTDGKGIAVYEESFILSEINIRAQKEHYRDSILNGGPWIVKDFNLQPDSVRTIWLRPEPFLLEFVNEDSITGEPIRDVRNHIRITDPDGTVREYDEISNKNGVIPIHGKEGSRVEIISEKKPGYFSKKTRINRLGDVRDKRIRMTRNLLPCNAGDIQNKNGQNVHSKTYDMGQDEGDATISIDFYGEPDYLTLIDGEGNVVYPQTQLNGKKKIPFHFKGGCITVEIHSDYGSDWKYNVNCP